MRFRIFACVFIFFTSTAFMNIESIRQNPKEGSSGRVGFKINGQSGNTEKFTGEFNTLHLVRDDENEFLGAGRYAYGESQHIKDTHEGNLHVRYTRYHSKSPAFETFAQTEFNEFKLLKRRDLLGLGLRTLLDRGEKRALYLGTGAFFEQEDFERALADEKTTRGNIYISFVRALSAAVSANVILYYQPSFEGLSDTRVQFDSALSVSVSERIKVGLEYDIQYDSEPPPGVEQTDSRYMAVLEYVY